MFDEVGEVCAELLRAVATGLEQPPEHFEQYFADKKTAMKLKCCSYPPPPPVDLCTAASPVDPDSLGVGPHKDYGFLAVVDQDVAGLEVLDRQGEWQPVPLLEGALVVNSGELLELASGGAFMASTHRVRIRLRAGLSLETLSISALLRHVLGSTAQIRQTVDSIDLSVRFLNHA